MTIKERFKRRKRFLLIGVFIGFALFAGVGALENKYPSAVLSAISYAGFFIAFSCIVILVFAFRCPRCNGRVITGAAMGLSLLSVPRYCSSCGFDFRAPSDEPANI
jgi:predicted RNA-binding Zn-ribbon protein involved in translation (DUF1610 family)